MTPIYKFGRTNLGEEAEERAINLEVDHIALIAELTAIAPMVTCRIPIIKSQWTCLMIEGMHVETEGTYSKGGESKSLDIGKRGICKGTSLLGNKMLKIWEDPATLEDKGGNATLMQKSAPPGKLIR